jgi:hypothetical protein
VTEALQHLVEMPGGAEAVEDPIFFHKKVAQSATFL